MPSISAGSGADADAALVAAIAVALAVAEEDQKPPEHGQPAPVGGVSPWVLEGRRRLMDSHGRAPR